MLICEFIPCLNLFRVYDPQYPNNTVAYVDSVSEFISYCTENKCRGVVLGSYN